MKLAPAENTRLLGGVKLAGRRANKAVGELERQVTRAVDRGCSLRDVAAAAGYDSHHKVQQVIARARQAASGSTGTAPST